MTNLGQKILPDRAYLRLRLGYDPATGVFLWRIRPADHFADQAKGNTWNTRYAGKPAGFEHGQGYRQIAINDVKFMAHRVAWLLVYGEPVPQEIDHIDGNRANNRITNLRAVTRAENLANSKMRANSSGAKGVYFDRQRGKYQAHIMHQYKYYHLGRFDTFEQAVAARRDAAERLHGKFARHE